VSAAQLARGYRLVELLKQPLNSPMPVEEQVVAIFAGTRGYIDDVPVADVKRFESELLDYFRGRHGALLDSIRTSGVPDDLGDAIAGFKSQFQPSDGSGQAVDPTAVDADELGGAHSSKTLATE
jgi:F-type H+-transporting ATPase subunit alpha